MKTEYVVLTAARHGLQIIKTETSKEHVDRHVDFFNTIPPQLIPQELERLSDTAYMYRMEAGFRHPFSKEDFGVVLRQMYTYLWKFTGHYVPATNLEVYGSYVYNVWFNVCSERDRWNHEDLVSVSDSIKHIFRVWLPAQLIYETEQIHGDLTRENILVRGDPSSAFFAVRLLDPGMVRAGVKCIQIDLGKLLQSIKTDWEQVKGGGLERVSRKVLTDLDIDHTLENVFLLSHWIRLMAHKERHLESVIRHAETVVSNLALDCYERIMRGEK